MSILFRVFDVLSSIAIIHEIVDFVRWVGRHLDPTNVEWRAFPKDDYE